MIFILYFLLRYFYIIYLLLLEVACLLYFKSIYVNLTILYFVVVLYIKPSATNTLISYSAIFNKICCYYYHIYFNAHHHLN